MTNQPQSHPHQKAFDLSRSLSDKENFVLFCGIPMGVGADSVDVEAWITEHWQGGKITDANYREVARQFLQWWEGGTR